MEANRELVDRIVALEWDMFVSVNEGEEKASCQEDFHTFKNMRDAQFLAWSETAARSYLSDLETARGEGRNLIEAKYIHMMRTTEPSKYEALLPRILRPAESEELLAHEISDMLLEQTRLLFEEFPYVAGQGRPLYSMFDNYAVSIETYQLGELLTYSENTLTALKSHILELQENNIALARTILENTVAFYGYRSLETAEAATAERAAKASFQISFGCCSD